MFQFSGLALFRVIYLQYIRLSHSEIFGSMLVCSYPKLIAAYHVLHRLLVPRHPPYALIRFKYCYLSRSGDHRFVYYYLTTCFIQHCCRTNKNCFPNMSKNLNDVKMYKKDVQIHMLLWYRWTWTTCRPLPVYLIYHYFHFWMKKSGGYRSRTDDPLRARQML